ncbi:MAG: tRNA (adenosine(37)-N6)-threonylcarbamoyltransferase complex dimerization subunit type 1 TsaB [Lentisphaeria bacterium]|nr:tRNA (adenosine(37)-N6)-threonylcarbamoyltransferase complex dimerization subunit type 1 TsaB [Lentisphaeria bacterium]
MDKTFLKMAIDFSGPCVDLTVVDGKDGKILLEANKLMQRREASAITEFISNILKDNNLALADVKEFTVGSGPGSFTGMRIAAAWVSGFTFGKKDIRVRTIPSAFALAMSGKIADGEKTCIIFDGRNREVIVFGVSQKDGKIFADGVEEILNKEQAAEFFGKNRFDRCITPEYDERAVKLILPDVIGKTLRIVKTVESKHLLADDLGDFDNDLTKLYYIRPSVANSPSGE